MKSSQAMLSIIYVSLALILIFVLTISYTRAAPSMDLRIL